MDISWVYLLHHSELVKALPTVMEDTLNALWFPSFAENITGNVSLKILPGSIGGHTDRFHSHDFS